MRIKFLGCGDAFGSGGRLNTCFHVQAGAQQFLIDCGATAMPAIKAAGIDRNAIALILLTHFHADHCGGIPPFILDAQFFAKRATPLTIAAPKGLQEWLGRAMETAFPGSSGTRQKFALELIELAPGERRTLAGIAVTPQQVNHGRPGGPFFAYRIEAEGRILAYSGDTEWVETLIEIGRDADLFIAEAYFRDKPVPLHLDLATLERHLDRIRPKRLILTHMSDEMLARRGEVGHACAADGLEVEI